LRFFSKKTESTWNGEADRSTAKEAVLELTTAEAKWNALIEQIDLRLVPGREGLQ
jgi:hypothetical protein